MSGARVVLCSVMVACGGRIVDTPPPPNAEAGLADVADANSDAPFTDATTEDAASPAPCSGAPTVLFAPKQVLTFSEIGIPQNLALVDVNGDGRLDIVMHEDSFPQNQETTLVFLQSSNGDFPAVSFSAASSPSSWAAADVTGDGRADVVETTDYVVVVRAGNVDGTLAAPKSYPMTPGAGLVVIGDFNGDHENDVVVQSNPCWGCSTSLLLFLQSGGALGSPVTTVTTSTTAGVPGDVNGDGLLDMVGVAPGQSSSPLVVVPGAPGGTFGSAYSVPFEGQALSQGHVVAGDVTGDGKDDVVVVPDAYPSVLLVSTQKNGVLSAPAKYPSGEGASAVALGDVNGDCLTDVVVQHLGWYEVGVYLQQGGGTLAPEVALQSVYGADVIAVGDVDGDGKNDIVTADQQTLVIFRNTH